MSIQSIKNEIKIPLHTLDDVWLCIYGNKKDTLKESEPEWAAEKGESPFQLLEGHFYNYYFEKNGNQFNEIQLRENVVVKNSLRSSVSEGRITTNIYVGQKLFDGHEQNRISTNAKYLVLFKNSRFKNE